MAVQKFAMMTTVMNGLISLLRKLAFLRLDGHTNGWLSSDFLNKRALSGDNFPRGTAQMLLAMYDFKKLLLNELSACLGFNCYILHVSPNLSSKTD